MVNINQGDPSSYNEMTYDANKSFMILQYTAIIFVSVSPYTANSGLRKHANIESGVAKNNLKGPLAPNDQFNPATRCGASKKARLTVSARVRSSAYDFSTPLAQPLRSSRD